jgi:hypothetical protein
MVVVVTTVNFRIARDSGKASQALILPCKQ